MAIYNGGLNIIAPDISGKEDKSNKVTAWSSTTTDEHYPSEKLVKDALDNKADESSRLRAVRRSVTSSQWAYDSVLYLGVHSAEGLIVSIKVPGGYAVPATIPDDPMWYAALYNVAGRRITSGTYTLEVTYLYKGVES